MNSNWDAKRKKAAAEQTWAMRHHGEAQGAASESTLAGTVYTEGPVLPANCDVCKRDPAKMNSRVAECSHVDCPYRGKAWSDRPTADDYYKGPWKQNTDADPLPVDVAINIPEAEELWDADPNCKHDVKCAPGGGVKCTKCRGWFCF